MEAQNSWLSDLLLCRAEQHYKVSVSVERTCSRMPGIRLIYMVKPTHPMYCTHGKNWKSYDAATKHDIWTTPLQTLSQPSIPRTCLRPVQSSFHSSLGPSDFCLMNKQGPKHNGCFCAINNWSQTGIINTTFCQHQMQSHYWPRKRISPGFQFPSGELLLP